MRVVHLDAPAPLAKVTARPARLDLGQHPRRCVVNRHHLLAWLQLVPCRRLALGCAIGDVLYLDLAEPHDERRVM